MLFFKTTLRHLRHLSNLGLDSISVKESYHFKYCYAHTLILKSVLSSKSLTFGVYSFKKHI